MTAQVSQQILEIYNLALLHLGSKPVATATQAEERPEFQLFYPDARDVLLSWYAWTFCTTRKSLVQLAAPPASDFERQFQVPTQPEVFRTLEIQSQLCRFKKEVYFSDAAPDVPTHVILTDATSVVLRYITRVDEGFWPPLIRSTCALLLAERMAQFISGKNDLQASLQSKLEGQLQRAADIDGHQDSPEIAQLDHRYLLAREASSSLALVPFDLDVGP